MIEIEKFRTTPEAMAYLEESRKRLLDGLVPVLPFLVDWTGPALRKTLRPQCVGCPARAVLNTLVLAIQDVRNGQDPGPRIEEYEAARCYSQTEKEVEHAREERLREELEVEDEPDPFG